MNWNNIIIIIVLCLMIRNYISTWCSMSVECIFIIALTDKRTEAAAIMLSNKHQARLSLWHFNISHRGPSVRRIDAEPHGRMAGGRVFKIYGRFQSRALWNFNEILRTANSNLLRIRVCREQFGYLKYSVSIPHIGLSIKKLIRNKVIGIHIYIQYN